MASGEHRQSTLEVAGGRAASVARRPVAAAGDPRGDPTCGTCHYFTDDDCRHPDWADFPRGATKPGDPFCSVYEARPLAVTS